MSREHQLGVTVAFDTVRRWKYQPQTIGGTPIPMCTTVSFAFSMR